MPVAPARLFRLVLATSLTVSALLFFVWSWHWPLVGDASLIHYIGFLIERGWAPYRNLGDMNMPGAYLVELAAMHVFGTGDLAWRLFDFTLLAAASAAFFVIARRENWLAGLFSASLFILIHGRDGLAEGGQRDLTMAVLLLAATAFLFHAVRRDARGAPSLGLSCAAAAFGLLSGIAVTIKPTALPLTLLQFALALHALRIARTASTLSVPGTGTIAHPILGSTRPQPSVILSDAKEPSTSLLHIAASAFLAYLVPPAIALAFLLREHALTAFLAGFQGILPYYASLGHRPLGFVLLHSISPLLPIVLAWLMLLGIQRRIFFGSRDWERNALLTGVLFGLANCIVQARALPYYRYPLLVFLLPLMALDFNRVLEPPAGARPGIATARARATHALALASLSIGGFFLAPQSAVLIHRYRWRETDFITSLERSLEALGGQSLSGHIQCIDSVSGCGNVLFRMRLEPATGVLSDFLLFGPPPGSPEIPIVRQTREQFSAAVLANPPEVLVVTSHLHIDGPDEYQKLARWPGFATFLAAHYTLRTEWSPPRTARWWSREETPASYRIYALRDHPLGPEPIKARPTGVPDR